MKTLELSEPRGGATTATVNIYSGSGNLTIDRLTGDDQRLASGTLEFTENQSPPTAALDAHDSQATLTVKGHGMRRPWIRMPWAGQNLAAEWHIHLNPEILSDIRARSGGGNVALDLSGMSVTRVVAETGGGNLDVVLPDRASDIDVSVGTGAGNVVVHVPGGVAVKLHASTGFGRVIVDPSLVQIDRNTYESPGYDHAASKAEITAKSGAGNVRVETK